MRRFHDLDELVDAVGEGRDHPVCVAELVARHLR